MKMKTVTSIPGYRVYEYLLVLDLPDEIAMRVQKVKEHFAETYKTGAGRGMRPQLALAGFTQYAMMEEKILARLQHTAMGFPPFRVELRDFGSFPSHTIYINVSSKVGVQSLVREIRSSAQRLMKFTEEKKPHFMMDPHITIARKLLPWQYEKGWLDFGQKHFTGRFIAENLTVLRREEGEQRYHPVGKFAFQNMPVVTKQGELFG